MLNFILQLREPRAGGGEGIHYKEVSRFLTFRSVLLDFREQNGMDQKDSTCHAVRHVGTQVPETLALEKLKMEGHWQLKVSSQEYTEGACF